LTACALLWPLCRPGEDESRLQELLPETVCVLRDQLRNRRLYHWVSDTYQQQRRPARHGDASQRAV
jgi:hypothetical protein